MPQSPIEQSYRALVLSELSIRLVTRVQPGDMRTLERQSTAGGVGKPSRRNNYGTPGENWYNAIDMLIQGTSSEGHAGKLLLLYHSVQYGHVYRDGAASYSSLSCSAIWGQCSPTRAPWQLQ